MVSQSPQLPQRLLASRPALIAALVAGVGVVVVPDARSAVTIGSDLSASDGTVSCGGCTAIGTAPPGLRITSPIDGVVVRWRVGNGKGTLSFRVVHNAGGGSYTGAARSAPATVTAPPAVPGRPPVVSTFETRLPVLAGDIGGLESDLSVTVGARSRPSARIVEFFPPLGDSETRGPQANLSGLEPLVNADIEPDADHDGYGDETQDRCAQDATTQGLCKGPCANGRSGTEGPDTVTGTEAGDNLFGLGGDDRLIALAGDDCVFGGVGRDTITGDAGADQLDGEAGPDSLAGGEGDDRLNGGAEVDLVSGGPGRDRLIGAAGNDRLDGGPSGDVLRGGAGNDVLHGTGGNDTLRGNTGNDRITGGSGRDKIDVGTGRNRASGGSGRDVIRARNRRRDRIACGSGRDHVVADAKDRVARDCERVTPR